MKFRGAIHFAPSIAFRKREKCLASVDDNLKDRNKSRCLGSQWRHSVDGHKDLGCWTYMGRGKSDRHKLDETDITGLTREHQSCQHRRKHVCNMSG
jgi:hypothetical protein